jgi:hypothetical protein
MTMEELHRQGGVPPGWRLRIPPGDPRAGRDVFVSLECFKCHAVKGEPFPGPPDEVGPRGPELTGMGAHHPPEYLAESILNPDAVIVTGPGYTGADGLSIMPDYGASMTVRELIDLVAYVASLGGAAHPHPLPAHPHALPARSPRERVVGELRVRLEYRSAPAAAHAPPGPGAGGTTSPTDHLVVFVLDAQSGEPVPYLPVSATIEATGRPHRTVQLSPTVGAGGFHYGADLTLLAETTRITVSIGATTMRVMPGAGARLATPHRISFAWGPAAPG